MTVAEYNEDDPGKEQPVLVIRRLAGAKGSAAVPLRAEVDGYQVRQIAPLDPAKRYDVLSASDAEGRNIIASGMPFKPGELREGALLNQDGHQVQVAHWLGGAGPVCHQFP